MADSEQVFPEARERAVRMLQEHIGEYPSFWATIESMAPRIDFVQQSLSECVDTHDVDSGTLDGVTKRHGVSEASISFVRRTPSRVQLRSASDQGGFLFVATIGQNRSLDLCRHIVNNAAEEYLVIEILNKATAVGNRSLYMNE